MTKSCFNCEHLHSWNYPATREDPGDSGWECGHPSLNELPDALEADFTDDAAAAEAYAKNCPGYQFKDWEKQYQMEAESEANYEIEPDPRQLQAFKEQVEQERLIKLGLLTADGEPTDEYYRKADEAYQIWRERR